MSAFSRGALFRHQCLFFHPPNNSQLLRSFTTSSLLKAAKKNSGLAKKAFKNGNKIARPSKPASEQPGLVSSRTTPIASRLSASATSSTAPGTYNSYQELLAKKSHPTLLYQAPSHTLFLISSYSASFFCFGYAIWNANAFVLHADPGLATWVPMGFAVICTGMAMFGSYLLRSPSRLIKSITAIPQTLPRAGRVIEPGHGVELEVAVRRLLPGLPAKKIYISPTELYIPRRRDAQVLLPHEIAQRRAAEERARKEMWEYNQTHIMSRGIRDMSRAFSQGAFLVVKGLAKAWSREGLMWITAGGKKYKLDTVGGWMLDEGKALERLSISKPKV